MQALIYARFGGISDDYYLDDLFGPLPSNDADFATNPLQSSGCFMTAVWFNEGEGPNLHALTAPQFLVFVTLADESPLEQPNLYFCNSQCTSVPFHLFTTSVASLVVNRPIVMDFRDLHIPRLGHTDAITGRVTLPSSSTAFQQFQARVVSNLLHCIAKSSGILPFLAAR